MQLQYCRHQYCQYSVHISRHLDLDKLYGGHTYIRDFLCCENGGKNCKMDHTDKLILEAICFRQNDNATVVIDGKRKCNVAHHTLYIPIFVLCYCWNKFGTFIVNRRKWFGIKQTRQNICHPNAVGDVVHWYPYFYFKKWNKLSVVISHQLLSVIHSDKLEHFIFWNPSRLFLSLCVFQLTKSLHQVCP